MRRRSDATVARLDCLWVPLPPQQPTLCPLTRQLVEQQLTAFGARRVPPEFRDQVRLSFAVKDHTVTLVNQRPYFRDPTGIRSHGRLPDPR